MGDHLILDNGAYENSFDVFQLLEAIEWYQPNVVVLPDYLLQGWQKTYYAAQKFLDTYADKYPLIDWGYCPQSGEGDIVGWVEGLVKGLEDSRISWIMLPRVLGTHITKDPFTRANVCRFVKRRGRRVHALGMLDGSVGELALLRDAGCDSIDSNAPVFRGWHGVRLGESWQSIQYSYDAEFPDDDGRGGQVIDNIILQNLEAVNVNVATVRVGEGNRV